MTYIRVLTQDLILNADKLAFSEDLNFNDPFRISNYILSYVDTKKNIKKRLFLKDKIVYQQYSNTDDFEYWFYNKISDNLLHTKQISGQVGYNRVKVGYDNVFYDCITIFKILNKNKIK